VSDILVDKGEYHGVGGSDDVKGATWGEGEEDARCQHKEEKGGSEQVHPHDSLSRGGKITP
jgi:hypothetical protein